MHKTFTPEHLSDPVKMKEALLSGPGEQSLRNIFAYSRALKVMRTNVAGPVSVIMN